jgi:hypothetical protein
LRLFSSFIELHVMINKSARAKTRRLVFLLGRSSLRDYRGSTEILLRYAKEALFDRIRPKLLADSGW